VLLQKLDIFIDNERESLVVRDLNLDYNKKGLLSYNHHEMFTLLEEMQNDLNKNARRR
jgi:hypothetical protein